MAVGCRGQDPRVLVDGADDRIRRVPHDNVKNRQILLERIARGLIDERRKFQKTQVDSFVRKVVSVKQFAAADGIDVKIGRKAAGNPGGPSASRKIVRKVDVELRTDAMLERQLQIIADRTKSTDVQRN
jgi:hypothetical protein